MPCSINRVYIFLVMRFGREGVDTWRWESYNEGRIVCWQEEKFFACILKMKVDKW